MFEIFSKSSTIKKYCGINKLYVTRPQDAIIQRKEVRFMTKIDIISGFLGAGKTTLIKKLLKEALGQEKVVLIENEFGEIGIDGGFLKEAGIQVTEMNSGCICCSLVGDFGTALREVVSQYAPDRIIIGALSGRWETVRCDQSRAEGNRELLSYPKQFCHGGRCEKV